MSFAARKPWVPSVRQVRRWTTAALAPLHAPVRISVRVVGDGRSRSLNLKFRRRRKSTNVLSFTGAGRMPDGRVDLGELVICAPVVAREARGFGKPLPARWAHMTVHGVLHLRGFEHERADEAAAMEALELQILERLGFSDPYAS